MVLKTRRPNRRGFKSTLRETTRRKREYYYSGISVFVVKIILLVFLCILLSVSTRLFYFRLSDNPGILRLSIPLVVLAAIIVLLYYIIRNYKDLREEYKNMH